MAHSLSRTVSTLVLLVVILAACTLRPSDARAQDATSAPPGSKSAAAAVRDLVVMRTGFEAREALRAYPPSQVIDALVAAIQGDPDFAEGKSPRLRAYEALAAAGDPSGAGVRLDNDAQIAQLVRGLSDPTRNVRSLCADALARVADDRRGLVKEPLVTALSDPWDYVELQALQSLAALALPEPVPPQVWTTATAPSRESRTKWRTSTHPPGWDVPKFDTETRMRSAAMRVVIAWEGLARPYAPEVTLDGPGTAARTLAAVRLLIQEPDALHAHPPARTEFLRDAVAFFKEGDGEPTDLDKGVLMALGAVARSATSDAARAAASAALRQCGESPSAPKQAAVQALLSRLEDVPRDPGRTDQR